MHSHLQELLAKSTTHECIQEAGDMIFVPDGWAHGVINLAESVVRARTTTNRRSPHMPVPVPVHTGSPFPPNINVNDAQARRHTLP